MSRTITPENPLDLFIGGIKVVDRPYPSCSKKDQATQAAEYVMESKQRRDPTDHFTAYIYSHQHTIQLPVEKHFYLRIPATWQVYRQSKSFVAEFLDGLVRHVVPSREFFEFRQSIRASMVWRKHGIGYRPKITVPPTLDSREYLYLLIHCSSPYLYNSLKRNLQSNDAKRAFWKSDFYSGLFSGAMRKYLMVWKNPNAGAHRANIKIDPSMLSHVRYLECFVGHEFNKTVNNNTMVLSNLGITSNGWIRITSGTLMDNSKRSQSVSNSRYEVVGDVKACGISLDEIEETRCAEMSIVSLDIECQSETGEFPNYSKAGDVVNYVGLVKYQLLGNEVEYDCLCLGPIQTRSQDDGKTVDTARMHVYQHETELLNGLADYINSNDIDVLETFNGLNFDWQYLDGRAVLASFIQHCSSPQQLFSHVQQYHQSHLDYLEQMQQLAELTESYEDYKDITKKEYTDLRSELFGEISETLGFGKKKSSYFEPKPKSIHIALWGVWPKETKETSVIQQRRNKQIALDKVRKLFEYFKFQPPVRYHYMHRLRAFKGSLIRRKVGSSAIGEESNMFPEVDRVHIDQFVYYKRSMFRFPSYSLNYIANHFLKVSKYDMPYAQLFKDYASGNPTKRRPIADYCVQDCDLPRRLDKKTNVVMNFIFLFKMTLTPLNDLALRGQQIRVFDCLYRKTRSIDSIINSRTSHPILTDYQGATVLPPKVGLHGGPDTWVPVLDFKSLYPSIIIFQLLCMMNLVLPDNLEYVLKLEKEGKIPPLHKIKVTDRQIYYFSKNPKCIIAAELRRLSQKRDDVKKQLKQAKGKQKKAQGELDYLNEEWLNTKLSQAQNADDKKSIQSALIALASKSLDQMKQERDKWTGEIAHWKFQATLFDLLQLGVKVVMNSFYGFFGVKEGMMPGLQPIAVCTTFYGRSYIERTKKFLFNLFDTHPMYKPLNIEIVYGDTDSVFTKIWPVKSLEEAIRIGVDMGERTTRDEFMDAIILEFEKVANPHYALPTKKCYIQRIWTTPEIDSCYVYTSGVVEKRRDNSPFLRQFYRRCREVIMPLPPKGSTNIPFPTVDSIEKNCALTLQTCLGELEDQKVPFDDYIITKSLSRAPTSYKPPVQAHVALALRIIDRINRREIVRMPPISGQRIPYVVCLNSLSDKIRDKVEDVDYLKMRNPDAFMDQIDRLYYLKSCESSISTLYCAIMNIKPFLAATKCAIEFQNRKRYGQTQLQLGQSKNNIPVGARRINPTRFFVSRQRIQKKTLQKTLFGGTVNTDGGGTKGKKKPSFSSSNVRSSPTSSTPPKKKKPKSRKKKALKMKPLFA